MNIPIVMTEEQWRNSQLSIAARYGEIKFNGHNYTIVNKDGIDIFTLSQIAQKEKRDKAIPEGEPADLCRDDFIPFYQKMGRNDFMKVINAYKNVEDKQLKAILKDLCKIQ